MSHRQIATRLFLTCWLVYTLHFATNIVREIYPALSLGDHFSFRVDEYANMHPDLFEKEGYGWHIGNNPGASMLAAIPYFISRPLIDPIVDHVRNKREASGQAEAPEYDSPWPMAREFYAEAWKRGLDIKFGLAAFVMQAFLMAPSTALGVVAMFYLMRVIYSSNKIALWLALLYAIGTPVFFRTGYLNHNMMMGHIVFFGFMFLWNPGQIFRMTTKMRYFLGGLAGGTALLFDYSGIILLLGLFFYAIYKQSVLTSFAQGTRRSIWYIAGTLVPVGLLWFYQWKSFGNPFLPGQHWMPPVEWIELGYQGFDWPQLSLFISLGVDYRYGLFTTGPLFLLALFAPFINSSRRHSLKTRDTAPALPRDELVFIFLLFAALWIFFSCVNYTKLQFNTGIRYMAPIFPFLFVPAAIVLTRLNRIAVYYIALISITISWCLAMYRDVESGLGVFGPLVHVFTNGLTLPTLERLSKMEAFSNLIGPDPSPLPLFLLTAAIIYGIWAPALPAGSENNDQTRKYD